MVASPPNDLLRNSVLYREHEAEQAEIDRFKWLESERLGFDIGVDRARVCWTIRHRSKWLKSFRSRD